jgi:predicted DNA binding protein
MKNNVLYNLYAESNILSIEEYKKIRGIVSNHKHKAKKYGVKISISADFKIMEIKTSDDLECYWCHNKITKGECEIDHIVPISRRGPHIAENIVASCHECNSFKQSKSPYKYNYTKNGYTNLILDYGPRDTNNDLIKAYDEQITNNNIKLEHLKNRNINLTDKQKAVLMKAFEAGFFEYPKKASIIDVANSIGISPSTAIEHLRKAIKNLIYLTLYTN